MHLNILQHSFHMQHVVVHISGSGVSCAAMVSSPFCLHSASAALSQPWTVSWMYNLVLAFRLRQYFLEHEHQMRVHASTDAVAEALTIAHFDKAVVCAIFGCAPVSLLPPRLPYLPFT